MVDMLLRPEGHVLVPDGPADVAQFAKLRHGRTYFGKLIHRRSVKHHRWWRGLVHIVAEGVGLDADLLHEDLKAKAGLVRVLLLSNGEPVSILRSTSFEAMDETRYSAYIDIGIEILFREYLPGVKRDDVFRRVRDLVGYDRQEAMAG